MENLGILVADADVDPLQQVEVEVQVDATIATLLWPPVTASVTVHIADNSLSRLTQLIGCQQWHSVISCPTNIGGKL